MNLSEQLKAKGWTVKDAAEFFGVSRQKLHSVLAEAMPTNLWVCAVNGMPKFVASMKHQHVKKKKQKANDQFDAENEDYFLVLGKEILFRKNPKQKEWLDKINIELQKLDIYKYEDSL